ncbi:thiopurine S-methyltransferase [bacterium]|nr:thiopurine S-methyltransferase [bacterium]
MTNWISRWESNRIGWHAEQVNRHLIQYLDRFDLSTGESIFVPLCGKTNDMLYLLESNLKVIGVEMSSIAIEQFFSENHLDYVVSKADKFILYEGAGIKLYCGDFFDLKLKHLENVRAIYDRASLIALNENLRQKYVKHLSDIIDFDARILLLTLNYPQHQRSGPPFAVSKEEVDQIFNGSFDIQELYFIEDIENEPMFQNLGVDFVEKAVYLLQKVRM